MGGKGQEGNRKGGRAAAWGEGAVSCAAVSRGWCVWAECVSGRMSVSVLGRARRARDPPFAPPPVYTLILFDRVVTPAPPGRPEMKSSPPAKPPPRGAVQ